MKAQSHHLWPLDRPRLRLRIYLGVRRTWQPFLPPSCIPQSWHAQRTVCVLLLTSMRRGVPRSHGHQQKATKSIGFLPFLRYLSIKNSMILPTLVHAVSRGYKGQAHHSKTYQGQLLQNAPVFDHMRANEWEKPNCFKIDAYVSPDARSCDH